jgi:hypothetical protein
VSERWRESELTRAIWITNNRIADLRQQLAAALNEKERLQRHLETLHLEQLQRDEKEDR